ncbi:hypothetical protein Q7C36_020569 [Tachysurus vachellii]|uniref:Uncharacterized protein n=1 Tax=Tachysurus vachellii TaxID=175792 RepID=A0AA88IQL5_TACVA|nr:hypothetical protein Q7C36_020569 [Tachysurus vachellii]
MSLTFYQNEDSSIDHTLGEKADACKPKIPSVIFPGERCGILQYPDLRNETLSCGTALSPLRSRSSARNTLRLR